MDKTYVVATIKSWNIALFSRLQESLPGQWHLISRPEDLTAEALKMLNPRYVFFPHWSWIIPASVFEPFECIIFHMADVPYGRGGSPLQNLIVRGHEETRISALRCCRELDGGPVYLKMPLSLYGSAEEIFLRASRQVQRMIEHIVDNEPVPEQQVGEVVEFARRKPGDGDIGQLDSLDRIYDYIRMLDAEGYPPAFLETGGMRLEFSRASMKYGKILADVTISKKKLSTGCGV